MENSFEVEGTIIKTNGEKFPVTALLDSGCTGTVIDKEFAKQKDLPIHKLPIPIPVYNADGTFNDGGSIFEFALLELQIGEHKEQIAMALSNLSTHNIFLGHDWLKKHNPKIDWRTQEMKFTCNGDHAQNMDEEHERLFYIEPEYLRNLSTNIAIATGEQKRTKTFEEIVPSEYHEFADVFAKETFDELPPRRPWDHAIELLPGDHKIDCKTYNLTSVEQKELDEFLEENLRTGRIHPSKSQFASTFFFVKKKDGKLCPVQDYRKLNDITVKNCYPLPLIGELVDKLKSAKYYTKLDIRWGYNNIRMKEGDEWKAAFHTNRGLFKPLVMFFGLTNSPTTFQTMMNHLFQDLINQGKVVVYMDDIMIFTNTLAEHQKIVKEVLTILQQNKLSLKHTKCEFEVLETEYLGLIVAQGSV